MEFRQVRTFNAAAYHRSIKAAAAELHFAQSTVSEQISALEKTLGVQLFTRNRHGLTLTEAGTQLFQHSQNLILWVDEIEQIVTGKQPAKTLQIGSLEALSANLLPSVLREFQERHPGTRIEVRNGNRGQLYGLVRSGRLDASITFGRPPERFDLQTKVIAEDTLVVIVPTSHPLADAEGVSLETLQSEQFIVTEQGCGFREMYDDHLGHLADTPQPGMVVQNIGTLASCVSEGLGCALLPEIAIRSLVAADQVKSVKVLDRDFSCTINLSWRHSSKPQGPDSLDPYVRDLATLLHRFINRTAHGVLSRRS
ncbi:LysR family transcriptional regulator [Paenarthrobacter sp. JL.01a]|uniref:LysR family transcriptional regulator n=1 Tax=Paenarthrobacter sp. JL.01a TaxID=2979324 RepID=UPI0021C8FBF9|nr:LysR family transcriptional regulator [Paenarthrobacter sp. JL.01a]UXM92209.1 LysR family transcriptional regulator [Paenarthrobacter sp. JL.01a]